MNTFYAFNTKAFKFYTLFYEHCVKVINTKRCLCKHQKLFINYKVKIIKVFSTQTFGLECGCLKLISYPGISKRAVAWCTILIVASSSGDVGLYFQLSLTTG